MYIDSLADRAVLPIENRRRLHYNTVHMPKHVKETTPSLSDKNTKSEILEAYKQLLTQLENKEEETSTTPEEQKAVESANHETVEKVLSDLSKLRLSANQTINTLAEQLTQEAERFAIIKKAIAVVQKELENTQKVKVQATQLYQMIELQKKTEEQFSIEMADKKNEWEDEQEEYENRLSRDREREEDEYAYSRKLQRQRDTDLWEEEKRKHDLVKTQEAEKRTEMIKELEELRKKVTAFPFELEKETKMKVGEAVAKVQREAHVQQTLAKQEAEGELKLAKQKIASLEATVTSLLSETKELKQQMEKATNHIKDIAVSVVEGARKESNPQARVSNTENRTQA